MKFICDQMLVHIGKWLRAAGYDTALAEESQSDREILAVALKENRLLLTRDRHFLEMEEGADLVIFLVGNEIEECIQELNRKINIDWTYKPFSRCLICNTVLEQPGPEVNKDELPADVISEAKELWFCPTCKKLYWEGSHTHHMLSQLKQWQTVVIGFAGDVMIGRLVNKVLIRKPSHNIWGDFLPILRKTDLNIINLEAALTHSQKVVSKVFNFKADPKQVSVLLDGAIHVVNLANNHILDYNEEGLLETLETLDQANIAHVGAGRNLSEAAHPAILVRKGIRVGFLGCTDNEPSWKAAQDKPGVLFLKIGDIEAIREPIGKLRPKVDLLILSIHWGPNMREKPTQSFVQFAHHMIDLGVDVIHGHSAHLFQGIEFYKGKLILYDTGDFVDDYQVDPLLRNDRSFFFEIRVNQQGIQSLELIPSLIGNCQVNIAKGHEAHEAFEHMQRLINEF